MRQIKYKKIELDVVQNESSISVFLLDVLEQRRERNPRSFYEGLCARFGIVSWAFVRFSFRASCSGKTADIKNYFFIGFEARRSAKIDALD